MNHISLHGLAKKKNHSLLQTPVFQCGLIVSWAHELSFGNRWAGWRQGHVLIRGENTCASHTSRDLSASSHSHL